MRFLRIIAIGLLGCSQPAGNTDDDSGSEGDSAGSDACPVFGVDNAELSFENGDSKSVTVTNDCSGTGFLVVTATVFGDSSFVVTNSNPTISPGTSADITISFSAIDGVAHTASLKLQPQGLPPQTITLSGMGAQVNYPDDGYLESCEQIKTAYPSAADGVYGLGSGETQIHQAYCDMTAGGGGWTMCYTAREETVYLSTEQSYTGTYGTAGHRADCRNIEFTEVLYVNHDTAEKAWFTRQSATAVTLDGLGYNASGSEGGLFDAAGGVANTDYTYQLLVCDSWYYAAIFISGYESDCYKTCIDWCFDNDTPYFRTHYDYVWMSGIAFNENGIDNLEFKTMSVGIR